MSSLLFDNLAEQRIQSAIKDGQLEDLPGSGKPIALDDDTFVPETLRMAYRILKNAGYLPPELEERQQALQLCELLTVSTQDQNKQIDAETQAALTKIQKLELKLRVRGMDTRFIHRYLNQLSDSDEIHG